MNFDTIFVVLFHAINMSHWLVFFSSSSINEMYSQFFFFLNKTNTRENTRYIDSK